MNKLLNALLVVFAVCFSYPGFSQSQPLIEPEIEVHDLFGMDGRNFRPGITGRSVNMATIRMSRIELEKGFFKRSNIFVSRPLFESSYTQRTRSWASA